MTGELRNENVVYLAIEIKAELVHIERALIKLCAQSSWALTSIRVTYSNGVKIFAGWVRVYDGMTHRCSGAAETYVAALENLILAAKGVIQ